jgi:transcriptional regulator with PAS, ATPase and Fis domain
MDFKWLDGIEAAVTVCDCEGVIVYMNARSAEAFKDEGGMDLIGKSLFECHQESSNSRIQEMLKDGTTNVYTVEKNGIKKFVWQAPWREEGVCKGLVEVILPTPPEIRHIVRGN